MLVEGRVFDGLKGLVEDNPWRFGDYSVGGLPPLRDPVIIIYRNLAGSVVDRLPGVHYDNTVFMFVVQFERAYG